MIRVLVVAESPAMRAGLQALLAADPALTVVDDQRDLSKPQDQQVTADVVITTSAPSEMAADLALGRSQAPPILFIRSAAVDVRRLLRLTTAWGIVPPDASAEELCAAVRALHAGLVVGEAQLLTASGEETAHEGPLTEREVEVLGLLAKGFANKQIALALGISEHTAKFHVSSICTKLNAANRTQAVREGLRNGWIVL